MSPKSANSRLKRAAAVPPAEESGALPSNATMDEVRNLFKRYAAEVSANVELSQASKTMYIDFAGCFVRWMVGGFTPGSHGSARTKPTSRIWPRHPLE